MPAPWPPAIGIFYGSTDGHTAAVAALIKQRLDRLFGPHAPEPGPPVESFDLADYYLEEMHAYDLIIAGVPTWNIGQLQRDWEQVLDEFESLDLSGKVVAIFGLGDQVAYATTFADAVFFIADRLRTAGATLVGKWPVDGYRFDASWAVEEGRFVGLILDEHNQPELTVQRLDAWCAQILEEYRIEHL